MTVPSDVNKHIYAGNGVTRVWPYTFLLYDASHLQVWVKRGDEESALLERGYVLNEQEKTVTYPPEGTGEAPLSAEDQIIIMRVVPVLQLLDLLNQGEFFAEDIEKQFDLVVMMIQQITETLRRAVVGPVDQNDSGVAYQTLLDAVEEAKAIRDEAQRIADGLAADNKAQIDAALAEAEALIAEAQQIADGLAAGNKAQIDAALAQVDDTLTEMQGLVAQAADSAEESADWADASCECARRSGDISRQIEAIMQSYSGIYVPLDIEDGGDAETAEDMTVVNDGGASIDALTIANDGQTSHPGEWYAVDPDVLQALNPKGITDISEIDENGEITITVDNTI